ncbi:MAG: endonuclease [Candidatus Sungbacteria bacterium]|uniref:Endonuclease n=1 Tax=Candidatus Sungiibacteriota bacterium TaxID=2750080 RepID=A0A931SDU6_9BACT|nr:endonuclease [Candidatus Sungbacteria bacterium]
MNTKLKGDIAEQAAILSALERGWEVLTPLGDRLPYDMVFDVTGSLVKIQVKCAWFDKASHNYVVDVRQTKTNRRLMLRKLYQPTDFDFALVYVPKQDIFYVFPVNVFISYGSSVYLAEATARQRKPKSATYRDAWNLISQWAAKRAISLRHSSNSGKPPAVVIPSQPLVKVFGRPALPKLQLRKV